MLRPRLISTAHARRENGPDAPSRHAGHLGRPLSTRHPEDSVFDDEPRRRATRADGRRRRHTPTRRAHLPRVSPPAASCDGQRARAPIACLGEAQSVDLVLRVADDVGHRAGRTVMRVGGNARQCSDDHGTGDVVTIPRSCVSMSDADKAGNHGLQQHAPGIDVGTRQAQQRTPTGVACVEVGRIAQPLEQVVEIRHVDQRPLNCAATGRATRRWWAPKRTRSIRQRVGEDRKRVGTSRGAPSRASGASRAVWCREASCLMCANPWARSEPVSSDRSRFFVVGSVPGWWASW